MKDELLAVLVLLPGLALAADQSPYAGEELRSIRSMSSEEIESLLAGEGMGFAKLAELNHYPGPKHVLELANDIELTASQALATEALFAEMRSRAVAVGGALLEAEKALDHDFRKGTVSPESLQRALFSIGRIRAQLRYVHLEAHLRQRRLLSTEQIAKYDEIRGYRSGAHDQLQHQKSHR